LCLKPLLHIDLDVSGKSKESFFHIDAGLSRCLHKLNTVFYRQLFSPFFRYLSSIIHITLIAQNHLLHISTGMFLDVPDPVLDVIETLLVGDVVDEHDPHGPPVVGRGDGPEPLLARSVPYLQLDLLTVQLYCTDLEVDSYCGNEGGIKSIF